MSSSSTSKAKSSAGAGAADDDGASPRELLIEACRRNNANLLAELLRSPGLADDAGATAQFLNTATDALGSGALHVAAAAGAYDVLDLLLDQEGVEIDGRERRDGDTPLHRAVRFANSPAGRGEDGNGDRDGARGREVVDILVDAGCDPRQRNKAKLKPIDLVDPRNKDLRTDLQKAEMAIMAGDDVVDEDAEDDVDGPGSESD